MKKSAKVSVVPLAKKKMYKIQTFLLDFHSRLIFVIFLIQNFSSLSGLKRFIYRIWDFIKFLFLILAYLITLKLIQ